MFFGISLFVSLSNPHRLGRKGSKSVVQPLGGLGLESLLVVRRSELKSVSVFLVKRLHWELLLIVLEKSSKLKVIFGVEVRFNCDIILNELQELLLQLVDFLGDEERVDECKISIS